MINDIQVKAIIDKARIARLATVDSKSKPHLVPVVFAFDGEHYYIPIDKKTKQEPSKLKTKESQEHSDKSKYCITYR
jgi:nitroimidazol reductase NimA-like FMN-containing flavoprotein (pyridoxamine 5'-phosphate oxidase superfamily)